MARRLQGGLLRGLFIGFAVMALVALLLGALSLTVLRSTLRRQEALVSEYLGEVVLVEELVSVSNAAARKARDFLLTGDEAHLRELETSRARFLGLLGELEPRQTLPGERERLEQLRAGWFSAGAAANRATAARQRTGQVEGETARIVEQEVLPERTRFDTQLTELARYERALYHAAQREADAAAGRAWSLLAAAFLGALGAALALGALLLRALRQRERAERERASLLAREQEARREAEEALALLDTLVATAPVGMAFLDASLRFVRVNQVLSELNGVPAEAHLGRTVAEVLPALAPTLEPLYRDVLAGRAHLGLEVSGPSPSRRGEEGHWLVSYYPVRDREGRVFMAGSVVVDISVRKRAEEELRRTAQFRERLIGIVSHDLRTPVTAISAGATLLLRTEGMPERALKTVRRISNSTGRMARMIEELLDFTRVRLGGGIPVQRGASDLWLVVRHVVEEVELAFPERTVRVETRGDGRGEWDEGRLSQVVGNLLRNALTYSPAETPVTVRVEGEDGWVRLEVRNENRTGPIPPEVLPALFDPFQRGGASHTQGAPEGLGLGLYITREIVTAHGGTIEVTSTEREGTAFTLRLPRAPRPQ